MVAVTRALLIVRDVAPNARSIGLVRVVVGDPGHSCITEEAVKSNPLRMNAYGMHYKDTQNNDNK